MRPSCAFIFRPPGGRGECRVPTAPAASCALCSGRTHTSNNGVHRNRPAFPHAMVLTAYVGLSPVTGLFCHRCLADIVLSLPGRADKTPQNLTPASGRQDHMILPSAKSVPRQRAVDRSQIPENPPCDPIARQTLPRPPHPAPTSVTIAKRPSVWDGMARLIEMFLPTTEAKYFCKEGWTALSTNRPTGKSLDCGESTFRSCPA